MAERHGQAEEKSEIVDETTQNNVRENKRANIARSVHSLFKDLVISAEGVLHFKNGAADYKTYLQRAVQMGGEIMDLGLPQTGDEEIRYEGDGRAGYWVALNGSDENGGRYERTCLEVHTATNWKFALWRFMESHLKCWASGWHRWTPYDYKSLSFSLCYALRHVGCTHDQFWVCDSGGWYHLDHIARVLHSYVTENEIDSRRWRPNWVVELRMKLAGRHILEGMTVEAWMVVLLNAMQP
jgi:hypothetical protein